MTVFSLIVTFRLCGCGRRQIWISFLSKGDKMIPIYCLRLCNVWSILHHGSVGWVHKKMSLNACIYFFGIAFHYKFCVSIIFISFSYEVSYFRNRILTDQKHKLVFSNCQRNCMLTFCWVWLFRNYYCYYYFSLLSHLIDLIQEVGISWIASCNTQH